MEFGVITHELDNGVLGAWTNRIIQIGYDYIKAEGERKEKLGHDLDVEIKKQGLADKKEYILNEIIKGFGLESQSI